MRKLKPITWQYIDILHRQNQKNSSKTRQENEACLFFFLLVVFFFSSPFESFKLAGNPSIAAKYEECVLPCSLLFSLYKHLSSAVTFRCPGVTPVSTSPSATSKVPLRPLVPSADSREKTDILGGGGLCKIF